MKTILTPFFLDQHIEAIEHFDFPNASVNRPMLTADDTQGRMSETHAGIASAVAQTLADGDMPIAVSGDCCAAIGTLAGLQRAGVEPLLIWLDSHGDINDWETTPSGFLGGMPLAMMLGIGEQRMMNAVGAKPLARHQVVLSDGRDLDPGEVLHIKQSGILHMPNPATLAALRLPNRPLWVHFDTDVLRLEDMPAAKYPAKGGPAFDTMRDLARSLAATGRIVAISMTPWATDMDPDGHARRNCMTVFNDLIGQPSAA